MKAIVHRQYGPPDVLRLEEIDKPTPKDDEVLVKIIAAAANPADWHFMRADPAIARLATGLFRPKHPILGADIAGIVEATGSDVTRFKPGDAVYADLSGCGFGGFAEYVAVGEDVATPKPTNLSFEEAAAVPLAGITALQGLRDRGLMQQGEKVLINGASGGVGTFAVQIAKYYGTEVTAVCSERNAELVTKLGADRAVDYAKYDFTSVEGPDPIGPGSYYAKSLVAVVVAFFVGGVDEATAASGVEAGSEPAGEAYDLILDCVGNHSVSELKRALSPIGRCIVVGFSRPRRMLGIMLRGGRKVRPMLARANAKDLAFLTELIEAGHVTPVIDRRYPLTETADAIRYLEQRHARGKVVINVAAEPSA